MKIRTPYEQAEKAGKQLLAKATEEHHKRKEYGKKDSYQACKEAATYLVHKGNGRVMVTGGYTYCCFDCLYRLSKACGQCRNGSHFNKKGAN